MHREVCHVKDEKRSLNLANHGDDDSEEDSYNSDSSFDVNSFDLYHSKS